MNDFSFATDLVANSLCKTAPPADNCKVEKNFVAALVPPAPAEAPTSLPAYGSPMAFAIVRSNLAGCEPLCAEWIYADGKITADTPALFEKVLAKTGSGRLPVIIRSDGGDVLAAMALGRMIHERKLDLAVGSTLFAGCSTSRFYCKSAKDKRGFYPGAIVSDNDHCNSACSLVLAAGQKRLVGYGYKVSLQKFLVGQKPASGGVLKVSTSTKIEVDLQGAVGKYLDEIGAGRELMTYMDRTTPLGPYDLSYVELEKLKLLTSRLPSSSLASNAVCQSSPPAENCIRR